ncbi:MAG: hypothetical protein ACR2MI_03750 [Flavobacteriaceae bacterium]
MRITNYLIVFLLISQLSVAQTVNDFMRLVSSDLNGSARYTSMAGAFGALGGDLTAISFNPASSSVFLHSELGFSANYKNKLTESTYSNSNTTYENDHIRLDHFGGVFVFNNNNEESPWSRISIGINFHKEIQYDQNAKIEGNNSTGVDQYFLYYADGLAFENLPLYDDETPSEVYQILGEEQGFASQQAFLGYQGYLIDPEYLEDENTLYVSNVKYQNVNHQVDIVNKGWHRKTSLNISGLYKNLLHLGVNVNFHKIFLNHSQTLFETNQDQNSPTYNINFNDELVTFGNGISTQIGAILKLKNIRFGATYNSPQWITLADETKQSISAFHYEGGLNIKEEIKPNITNFYEEYQLKIPSKTTLSIAYLFGLKGLISIDYSNQNLSNSNYKNKFGSSYLNEVSQEIKSRFDSVYTLKVGGEFRFKDISLRGGFLNQNAYQRKRASNNTAITLGLGLDFGSSSLSLSLVNFEQNKEYELYSEGLTDVYTLNQNLTQFAVSYNFKL